MIKEKGYLSKEEHDTLVNSYEEGILAPTVKEKLVINPKVAYEISHQMLLGSIPFDEIKKLKTTYGELTKPSKIDPVGNLLWDYLYFVDSDIYKPAATRFEKSRRAVKNTGLQPSYCDYPKGTKAYKKYWAEEFQRITKGYEPMVDGKKCGLRISGEYYFYLNYCLINQILELPNGKTINIETFPQFLTMDYYFYRELEARENPHMFGQTNEFKKSIVLSKSRRKGFSFKCASGCVWIAAFNNNAKVGIASAPSSQKTDGVTAARKCIPIIDHLSKFTPFGRKNVGNVKRNGGWKNETLNDTDKKVVITLGLFNTVTGEKAGRQSTIFTMSLSKDDAASGEGLYRLYFEEAGKTSNIQNAWVFARESMKAGSLYRGIAVIFGTGGSMVTESGKDGNSKGFSILFNNPVENDLAAYDNIYEYNEVNTKCGFFVCDMWSNFGAKVMLGGNTYKAIDSQGNACFWAAELALNKERFVKKGADQAKYDKFLTQRCKTPQEAFYITNSTVFNVGNLIARKTAIEMSPGGFEKFYIKGELLQDKSGNVSFMPDLMDKLRAIEDVDSVGNKEGCLKVYEQPRLINNTIPDDAYLISVDPIGQNASGKSLTAIIVMKTPLYAQYVGYPEVVAIYVGRRKFNPMGYVHELLINLSKFYNAKITYENDRDGGILQYFTTKHELHRLLPKPSLVMNKYLPNSKTLLREFGHSMASVHHKAMGEVLLNEWLDYRHPRITGLDEKNNVVVNDGPRNVDLLKDNLILSQLISYNRAGNFDVVMALIGAVIQLNERYNPEYNVYKNDNSSVMKEVYGWVKSIYPTRRMGRRHKKYS